MCAPVGETIAALLRHLAADGRVVGESARFGRLSANAARVDRAVDLLREYDLLPKVAKDEKSDAESAKVRQLGNQKFRERKRGEAVELYTRSACLARDKEFLAVAYANRSAVLLEVGLAEECLRDINRALENDYPASLKPKLLQRKERAENLLKNNPRTLYHHLSIPVISKKHKNKHIQCASDAIRITSTPNEGRHIVATRDINIGEVLAVEEPFCHILREQFYSHCHHCLKLCYDLIPCKSCTQTLFCSEACEKEAVKYHRYECSLSATINKLGIDKSKLLSLRIALLVKDQYPAIKNDELGKGDGVYRSDRYLEIHNLIGNTEKRTVSDLFYRAATTAIIFHLIESFTSFFNDTEVDGAKDVFKELVLKHNQTGACNFHSISETAENMAGIYTDAEMAAGAYSFLSMFNHSCDPNVTRISYGPTKVSRAVRSIKKGEQCFDNYSCHFAMMQIVERQIILKDQYYFECSCTACVERYPLYNDLPEVSQFRGISEANFTSLQNGDIDTAKRVAQEILPEMEKLEKLIPNRNFCELQEILKQCFALFGNIRRPL